jgi:hypothetical protein
MEFSASEKGVRFMRNHHIDEIIRHGRGGFLQKNPIVGVLARLLPFPPA